MSKIETEFRGEPVNWHVLKGTSQSFALDTRADHTLYCGSRGPGKTDTQLMRFRRHVGMGYGAAWRGIIFDKEYKNLDDLVTKSKRWFYGDWMQPRFLESKADYRWIWPDGAELLFRTLKTVDDYWNYHGHEYPFIGWNELCKFANRKLYDDLMSCNRSSFLPEKDTPKTRITYRDENGETQVACDRNEGIFCPPIPTEVFATTNSYGPGRPWVKKQFIDPVPYGVPLTWRTNVFNPRTQQREVIEKSQITFFGLYKENPFLSPKYVADLENIKDKNKRRSWLMGDWNITAGGALDDLWDNDIHIVQRFSIPKEWHLDRTFDWGSSHPFAVTWWAEANGEEVTLPNGEVFCPISGSLICFLDYYGCSPDMPNEGLRMDPRKIAINIKEREIDCIAAGWIVSQPYGGPADNQIRNVIRSDVETIEKTMADAGIRWTSSDKSRGSRQMGLQILRSRLEASLVGERPGIYFMENCRDVIATVPVIPRDPDLPDDVDTDAEDHLYDTVRYRVLKGENRLPKKLPDMFGYGSSD